MSFSLVLQSYQDNGLVIIKGSVQWNPVNDWKETHLQRALNPGPLEQQLVQELNLQSYRSFCYFTSKIWKREVKF